MDLYNKNPQFRCDTLALRTLVDLLTKEENVRIAMKDTHIVFDIGSNI